MITEENFEVTEGLAGLRATWKKLPSWLKIFGYVVFIWAAWRTVPVLSVILQLVVLAVGLLFLIACIGASEETVVLLNQYRAQVVEYMRNPNPVPNSNQEEG